MVITLFNRVSTPRPPSARSIVLSRLTRENHRARDRRVDHLLAQLGVFIVNRAERGFESAPSDMFKSVGNGCFPS